MSTKPRASHSPEDLRAVKITSSTPIDAGPIDLSSRTFDPHLPELLRTWSSYATNIISINCYPNGLTYTIHETEKAADEISAEHIFTPSQFHLRLPETREMFLPAGRMSMLKDDALIELERRLHTLKEQGTLNQSVIYLGLINDPFLPLHRKFAVTMGVLDLLERYAPQLLVIQTRSPMVISALPTLKMLREQAIVAMHLESPLENVVQRYTPGQPRISERLLAVDGLRCQGVKINLVVSPILPYGDVHRDAWKFAEILNQHADYITFGCLAVGTSFTDQQLRNLPVSKKLIADKNLRTLRPHAYRHVFNALKQVAPEKLLLPIKPPTCPAQLKLFAA
ncbi:hypothetical protein JNK13_00140 [bacterium]|nr:hypothetical protein [bacterium]